MYGIICDHTVLCKRVRTAKDAGINAQLERYVEELKRLDKQRGMRGLYKHLKESVGLDGKPSGGQQFIKDEKGVLPRSQSDTADHWKRFFGGLLNTKSPKHLPDIVEAVRQ